jgi:hypothetical protein
MSVTDNACRTIGLIVALRPPTVARPCQRRFKLLAHQLFDEPTDTPADLGLNRINPVVEKMDCSLALRLQRLRLRGNARHGVVSSPALQRRMIRG